MGGLCETLYRLLRVMSPGCLDQPSVVIVAFSSRAR